MSYTVTETYSPWVSITSNDPNKGTETIKFYRKSDITQVEYEWFPDSSPENQVSNIWIILRNGDRVRVNQTPITNNKDADISLGSVLAAIAGDSPASLQQ